MNYIFGIILLFFLVGCKADNQVIQTGMNHSDSLKVYELAKNVNEIQDVKPDSAIKLALKIRQIVSTPNATMDYYQKAVFLHTFYSRNSEKSKLYKDSAVWFTQLEPNQELQYKSDYISGLYWLGKGNAIDAATCLFQSLQNQPEQKDSVTMLYAYGALSKIYSEYKDYNLAAKYYLPIINSLDFSSISELNLIPILNGYTFFSAADSSYAQYADKCLFAARNYIEKKSTAKFNSLLYFQLSHYFFNNNNIDSGIIYANKSIQNIIEHPNSSGKS